MSRHRAPFSSAVPSGSVNSLSSYRRRLALSAALKIVWRSLPNLDAREKISQVAPATSTRTSGMLTLRNFYTSFIN